MIPLQPVGRFHPQDADGCLLNDAGPDRVVYPWRHIVEAAGEVLERIEGANLGSLFVRGSVAQGTAQFGVSDVDIVGITRSSPKRADVGPDELALEARFPFCTGVELVRVDRNALLSEPDLAGVRFALAALGACMKGENVLPLIPRPRPGRGIAFYAPTIERRFAHYRDSMVHETDLSIRAGLTRWIGKSLARAGFDLVMESEGRYTSHVLLCWERFSAHYPAMSSPMREAVDAAVNPPADFVTRAESLTTFIRAEWR